MKRIIGISGIAIIAMAIFINTNSQSNSDGDFGLAALLTKNTAHAEQEACLNPPIFHNGPGKWAGSYGVTCYNFGEVCGYEQNCYQVNYGVLTYCQSATCL